MAMGLDLVELAMRVESEFRLTMTDAEAGPLCTAGDIHRFVCQRVGCRPARCLSQRAFQAVRRVLMAQGMARQDITLERNLDPRALDWKALERDLGQRLTPMRPASITSWFRVSLGLGRENPTMRELVMVLRDQLPGQDWAWTESRVWSHLVRLIADQFGIAEDEVRPDTDFVLDLGAC